MYHYMEIRYMCHHVSIVFVQISILYLYYIYIISILYLYYIYIISILYLLYIYIYYIYIYYIYILIIYIYQYIHVYMSYYPRRQRKPFLLGRGLVFQPGHEKQLGGPPTSQLSGENMERFTLWQFNIAIENGHRNSGFSH